MERTEGKLEERMGKEGGRDEEGRRDDAETRELLQADDVITH